MHRCLQVPEILQNILDSLEDASRFPNFRKLRSTRRARASMACTCRLFYEPSMDSLWSTLYSLNPLVRCLPSHTWELREVGGVEDAIWGPSPVIIRAPVEGEWARFLTNAARVKELHLRAPPSVDHLRTMRMHLPPPCLPFPRLRKISIPYFDSPSISAYIPMLLNPYLRYFSLEDNDPDVVCAVLGILFDRSPDICALFVSTWNTDSIAFIPRFRKLQELRRVDFRLPSSASPVLSSLATSACLTTLSIRAPKSLAFIPQIQDMPTFPSLVDLQIDSIADVLVADALLRLVSKQNLSELVLYFEEPSDLSNAGHLNTLLKTISTFEKLKELKLTHGSDDEGNLPLWNLDPLWQLTSLEDLFITLPGYSLSRDLLRRRSDTPWPSLKFLFLRAPDTLPPIDILGDLAHCMPNLSGLVISVDATDDPASPVPLGQSTVPVQLCLDGSPILAPSCASVAAYIALAYPNAALIYDGDYNEEDVEDVEDSRVHHARCWNKVLKMFPVMVSVADAQRTLIRDGKVDMEPERLVSGEE